MSKTILLVEDNPSDEKLTLLAFKTGARANNPAMSALVASYSDDDLKTMARYLGGIHNQ